MTRKTNSIEVDSRDTKPELDVTIPDPTPVIRELHQAVNALDQRLSSFLRYIFGALGIAFLTLLFMVVGLAVETWRFNSLQYKAYLREEIRKEVTSDVMDHPKTLLDSVKKLEKELQELKELRVNQAENQPAKNQ